MADFMFVKDAASLWNISERQVSGLCSCGKIPGAVKQRRSSYFPQLSTFSTNILFVLSFPFLSPSI